MIYFLKEGECYIEKLVRREFEKAVWFETVQVCIIQKGGIIGEEILSGNGKYYYNVRVRSNKALCFTMLKTSNLPEFHLLQIYPYLMKKYRQKKYNRFTFRKVRDNILDGLLVRKNQEKTKPAVKNSNKASSLMPTSFGPDQQEAIKFTLIPDEVLEQVVGKYRLTTDPEAKDWNLSEQKYIKNICRLVLGVFRCTDVSNIKLAWNLMKDETPVMDVTSDEMQNFMIKNYPRIRNHLDQLMKKEQFTDKQIALNQKKFEAMMQSFGITKTQKSVSSALVYSPVEPQALISKIGSLSGVAMSNDIVNSFWGRIREKMDNYEKFEYPAEDVESQETNFLTQPKRKPRKNIAPKYIRRPDCAKMLSHVLQGIERNPPKTESVSPFPEPEGLHYLSSLTTDFHFTVAEFKKFQQNSSSARKLGMSSSAHPTEPDTPSRMKALIPGRSALLNSSSSRLSTHPHAKSQDIQHSQQPSFKAAYDMFNAKARVIGPMQTSRWDSLHHLIPNGGSTTALRGHQGTSSSSRILPAFVQPGNSQVALPTFDNLQPSGEKTHRRGDSTAVGSVAGQLVGIHTHERLPSGAEFRIRSRNGSSEKPKMNFVTGGPTFGAF